MDAEVLGVDLALMQASYVCATKAPPFPPKLKALILRDTRIPPNVSFAQRDIESPWHGLDQDSWDLIHIRMLNGSVQNWESLYQKVFKLV